jgi:hypothetical protein
MASPYITLPAKALILARTLFGSFGWTIRMRCIVVRKTKLRMMITGDGRDKAARLT